MPSPSKKTVRKKAGAARKSAGRRGARARARPGLVARLWHRLRRVLGLAFLFLLLATILYTIWLDQLVRGKFEGKRWALPARVYAQPLELFAGAEVDSERMLSELERLGYRRERHPDQPGAYSYYRNKFIIRTRSFEFWDGPEPSRYLELKFAKDRLASIKQAAGGQRVPLMRLEPPLIGSIHPAHHEDRILVRRDELPPALVASLLAVEDREFFQHHGVNPKSIARAAWVNLRAGGVVQGGSTLTQQLVKNFYLSQERSLWRKLNEALMALLLEWRYSKDEILEAYANEIFLGQDGKRAVHGFGLASQFYFNRPLEELELQHHALLVAMVRGPSQYEPRRHPKRARERRNLVLRLLREQGAISLEQEARAVQAPLGISAKGRLQAEGYPAFLDLVRRQLHRDYRAEDLNSEGLRIFTTLETWTQEQAEQALAGQLASLERRYPQRARKLEGASVVVSPDGGEVLALVGGRDPQFAGFNRALDAVRPIGSLIKPVVYLEALARSRDYNLLSELPDRALRVQGHDGQIWSPENYDRKEHGQVRLYQALANSYNLATVRLGMQLGLPEIAEVLRQLGVQRRVNAYPAMLLGSVSLSPLEVAQLYQALAAGGFHAPLRAIREVMDAQSQPLQRYPLKVDQVVAAGPTYLLSWALQQVVAEGTAKGLSQFLDPELQAAGKTGTTNDLRDSWFAGFTGDKVAVVWVGRDDNQSAGLTGSSGALQVWGETMRQLRPRPLALLPPDGVDYHWIEPVSGLLANADCPGARQIPFIRGSAPTALASCAVAETDSDSFFRRFFE